MSTIDGARLIDLGEYRSVPAPEGRGLSAGYGQRVLAAVLVACALLVAGGPERVAPRLVPLAEVPATRSAVVALSADTAFLGDWSDAVVDGRRMLGIVSAYRLPGGAPRWRARLPVPPQGLRLAAAAGVVLAVTVVDGAQEVTALDAGTGRVLWRTDWGGPVDVAVDGAGALFYGPGPSLGWLDLRTGRTVWSRSLSPYGAFGVVPGAGASADHTRVLTMLQDGGIEVVDEATGAHIASDRLGPGGLSGDGGTAEGVGAVLGRILVMRRQASGSLSVTAFDPDLVGPLWTVDGVTWVVPKPCGDFICMRGADGLLAVDPTNGSTAWRAQEWDEARPLDRERLLASAVDPGRGLAVLDAATGRVVVRLSRWTSVDDLESGLPTLVTRPDDSGGSIMARLDPGGTRPTVLGDLRDAAPSTCLAAGGVLACATVRRTLRMWRYGA